MTTKQTEFEIVKYFLKHNSYGQARIRAVHANVVARRQFGQSLLITLLGIFVALVGTLINNAPQIPHNVRIGEVLFALGGGLTILFIIRGVIKLYNVRSGCDYENGAWEDGLQDILETIKTFEKLFGKRPEKLGLQGTARFLTHEAGTILRLNAQRRSPEELILRKRFRDMHDVASKLMPMSSYEEIYHAAQNKQQRPTFIPGFTS